MALTSTPARRGLLIDAAVAIAVLAGSIALLTVGTDGRDEPTSPDGLAILLAALASLPLVARRRAPLGVFVATALANVALRLVADPAGPPLGPTVALYWLAAGPEGSRERTRFVMAVVVAMLVAHVSASGLAQDRFPLIESLFGVLVWGGAWLAGERGRLRQERMAELEQRALSAEREAERERRLAAAEERTRIARDLHDSAGHAINVILVHAGLGRLHTADNPDARQAFETIEDVARETVDEIDEMVRALRDDGSASATRDAVEPPAGIAALDGLLERHRAAGLDVEATVRGDARPLPAGVDRAAYRILQEALTNAARHGEGSARLEISFGRGDLDLAVTNPVRANGSFDADAGHGVVGMRERASLLGGTLEAGARDGRFQVHARLPLTSHRR